MSNLLTMNLLQIKNEMNNLQQRIKNIEEKWDFDKKSIELFWEETGSMFDRLNYLSREARLLEVPVMSPIGDKGNLYLMKEFIEICKTGGFIDYDGFGYYATEFEKADIIIHPSDIIKNRVRTDFTHVLWLNR